MAMETSGGEQRANWRSAEMAVLGVWDYHAFKFPNSGPQRFDRSHLHQMLQLAKI